MRPWVFALAALCCACQPPPPHDDAGVPLWPDGAFVLGTPQSDLDPSFQALPAQLVLHPGSQGGFHAPLLYRVDHQTESAVVFEHRVTRSRDGVLVSKGTRTFDIDGAAGSWVTDGPVVIFLCPTPVGVSVTDEALTFEITATKASTGLLGRAIGQVIVQCPDSGKAFCQSVCGG
jgi:hypothetical protein